MRSMHDRPRSECGFAQVEATPSQAKIHFSCTNQCIQLGRARQWRDDLGHELFGQLLADFAVLVLVAGRR